MNDMDQKWGCGAQKIKKIPETGCDRWKMTEFSKRKKLYCGVGK